MPQQGIQWDRRRSPENLDAKAAQPLFALYEEKGYVVTTSSGKIYKDKKQCTTSHKSTTLSTDVLQ